MCHQSGGLVARAVERSGIPTVGLGQHRGNMLRLKYPRIAVTPFPRGETVGPPGDRETQRRVLAFALQHLVGATAPAQLAEYAG